jgi:hypothetical protein
MRLRYVRRTFMGFYIDENYLPPGAGRRKFIRLRDVADAAMQGSPDHLAFAAAHRALTQLEGNLSRGDVIRKFVADAEAEEAAAKQKEATL